MMTVRCCLAPSPIEGLGVYALKDIAEGDVVRRLDLRYDRLIPLGELERCSDHTRGFLQHYGRGHPGHPLHLLLEGDEGRYMNHSCTPNVDASGMTVGVAIRDIKAGEELTCDYADFTLDGPMLLPPRCPPRIGHAAAAHARVANRAARREPAPTP